MLSLFVFLIIYKNSFVFKITLSITETILFNLGNDEKSLIDNKEDLFTTIPEKTNCRTFIFDKEEKKNDNVSQEQR